MTDSGRMIEQLRATIAVLEEENAQLSERAEDAMLLGVVAEALQGIEEPQEVFVHALERVSILKDLPFITCGRLSGNRVEEIASYARFTDRSGIGYPIILSADLLEELRQGPFICQAPGQLTTSFADARFSPSTVLLVPFNCHFFADGLFLFFDRQGHPERLAGISFLIDQVVNMVVARLENLFLTRELTTLNDTLQEKYRQKTEDLVRTNERLQEAHARYTSVLDGIDSPIAVTDMLTYEIVFANRTARDLFPAAREGMRCYRTMGNGEAPCSHCRNHELISAAGEQGKIVIFESQNHLNGKWYLNRETILPWPDIPLAKLRISTDITALKQAEEEKRQMQQSLQQAQKLEALGIMAGSVAHDLNNILSGIVSYPDLLLATLPPDSDMRRPLETMQEAGRKAATIVRDLLTMARRGIRMEETVDLAAIVRDYLASTEGMELIRLHEGVRFIPPEILEPMPVSGSPVHLSNILMNLVTNAAEAMPDGGTVTIRLERVALHSRPQEFQAWRPGDYARLTVADTGAGIPETYRDLIFDPFFTRKKIGRSGTGLGLAVVWGTVLDHQGYITVDSTEGKGTTFHIHLPLIDSTLPAPAEPQAETPLKGRGESVLVVDDRDNQRQIASEILHHLGYTVASVDSGEAALQHLQQHPVDLVLLDMIMPQGIDGLETYKRILAIRPGQKAIIVSGFSRTEHIEEARSLGVSQFVAKPYTMMAISLAVRRALADT